MLTTNDIESLNWKLDLKKINYKHPNSNLYLQYFQKGTPFKSYIRIYNTSKESGCFTNELNLKIDNIQELEVLMKQLEININYE